MDDSTVIEFALTGDVWAEVSRWAEEMGYREIVGDSSAERGTIKVYRRGTGALSSARMLSISEHGGKIRFEGWIQSWPIVRILGVPERMGIEPGGLQAALPRKRARADLNRLLSRLGGPTLR